MTNAEAEKLAKILDHKQITAHVISDGIDGSRLTLLVDQGPNHDAYRLILDDTGWEIQQGKRLIAWNPIE